MLKQHNLPSCAFKVHMSELQVLGALEGVWLSKTLDTHTLDLG